LAFRIGVSAYFAEGSPQSEVRVVVQLLRQR
jgi:hypothetical protein